MAKKAENVKGDADIGSMGAFQGDRRRANPTTEQKFTQVLTILAGIEERIAALEAQAHPPVALPIDALTARIVNLERKLTGQRERV